jgi:hypothetical protein
VLRHDHPEHGVAEELETLVRRRPRVLGAPRPMGQGAFEQAWVVERVSETLDQPGVGIGGDQLSSRPCT